MDTLNIPRADEETVNALIDMGILYVGEDHQIYVKTEE